MEDSTLPADGTTPRASRFELAPPRRFILPAILLLLSEQPGYGYGLVPRLEELRFGHVDRPAVYRALARLEADGLVEPLSCDPKAGQARRVYGVTGLGERVLRVWMGVVNQEHECLDQVLRRYQATGTTDAVLAEVEDGWVAALRFGWSPVSPTSTALRHLVALDSHEQGPPAPGAREGGSTAGRDNRDLKRYLLVPERSVVLIDVRSTVGPLSFGAIGVTGSIDAAVVDGSLDGSVPPAAHLEIDVRGLRSGNRVYDAELLRRIDARRFPRAVVDLRECSHLGPGSRYQLVGEINVHGVTRPAQGTVSVETASARRLVIKGEQALDIRDFSLASPTVLMLRIYPDVRVRLHAEADLEVVH